MKPLSRLMYIDSTIFLPDDLMIKNDRMTMAHSLEARVPFTDPELTRLSGFGSGGPEDEEQAEKAPDAPGDGTGPAG